VARWEFVDGSSAWHYKARVGGRFVLPAGANVWGEVARKRGKKEGVHNSFAMDLAQNRVFGSPLGLATCRDQKEKCSNFINLATTFTAPLEISFFLITL
jgi:hypothetical protein